MSVIKVAVNKHERAIIIDTKSKKVYFGYPLLPLDEEARKELAIPPHEWKDKDNWTACGDSTCSNGCEACKNSHVYVSVLKAVQGDYKRVLGMPIIIHHGAQAISLSGCTVKVSSK